MTHLPHFAGVHGEAGFVNEILKIRFPGGKQTINKPRPFCCLIFPNYFLYSRIVLPEQSPNQQEKDTASWKGSPSMIGTSGGRWADCAPPRPDRAPGPPFQPTPLINRVEFSGFQASLEPRRAAAFSARYIMHKALIMAPIAPNWLPKQPNEPVMRTSELHWENWKAFSLVQTLPRNFRCTEFTLQSKQIKKEPRKI